MNVIESSFCKWKAFCETIVGSAANSLSTQDWTLILSLDNGPNDRADYPMRLLFFPRREDYFGYRDKRNRAAFPLGQQTRCVGLSEQSRQHSRSIIAAPKHRIFICSGERQYARSHVDSMTVAEMAAPWIDPAAEARYVH
jgi:hypothetical protein